MFDNSINESSTSLLDYFKTRYNLDNKQINKMSKLITQNWEEIEQSIKVIRVIKNRLKESIIGIIETENITATDSQMIFMLINSSGSKLSAIEVLSAKPAWNIKIKKPSISLEESRVPLYEAIKTQVDDTVRWDIPATTYDRLNQLSFLLPNLTYNKNNELEKKLTLGFKILSGIYQKGIKKEDVDQLAVNKSINWESDIDKIIDDINLMGRVLSTAPYFQFLNSWNQTFLGITSDAIALNFLFTTFHDFKGSPVGNKTKTKNFIHNVLF